MSKKLITKWIGDDQVTDSKILLGNATWLRARNFANTGNVNLLGLDASDTLLSYGDFVPRSGIDTVTGVFVDNSTLTPSSTDIYLTQDSAYSSFDGFGSTRVASKFMPTLPGNISAVNVYLEDIGTNTGNLTVKIYSDSAGSPGSLLGTSDPVSRASVTASSLYAFTFTSPVSIVGGTSYWFSVEGDSAYNTAQSTTGIGRRGANYSTWPVKFYNGAWVVPLDTTSSIMFTIEGDQNTTVLCDLGSLAAPWDNLYVGQVNDLAFPTVDGTAGQAIVTDGFGNLTFATIATGANVTLSNLTSPTAINQDLTFASNGALRTPDHSISGVANTNSLSMITGSQISSSQGGNTGDITVHTGDWLATNGFSPGNHSGHLNLTTGIGPGGGGTSGNVTMASGDGHTGVGGLYGDTGNLLIQSGGTGHGYNTGNISLIVGLANNGGSPGVRGKIQFQDGSEGVAGYIWTSSDTAGSGAWAAAPATGANQTLSNLTNPTAINQNLLFNTGAAAFLQTKDNTGTTQALTVKVGASTTGAGALNLLGGVNPIAFGSVINMTSGGGGGAGAINITTPSTPGGGTGAGMSGAILIQTGVPGSSNSAGTITLQTSATTAQNSAAIILITGDKTGAGSSGDISMTVGTGPTQGNFKFLRSGVPSVIGQVWTATGTAGEGYWATAAASGANTALSNLASVAINTDLIWGSGVAGLLKTADAGGTTQNLIVRAGDSGGSGSAGTLLLRSGSNSGSNNTGALTLQTGDHSGVGSGVSGIMTIRTGTTNTNASGALNISSGNSTNTSGNISIASGTAVTRGSILIDSTLVQIGTGAGIVENANGVFRSAISGNAFLGDSTHIWNTAEMFVQNIRGTAGNKTSVLYGHDLTLPDGAVVQGSLVSDTGHTTDLAIWTWSQAASKSIKVETGNGGGGNSGDIHLRTGTSSATRGKIKLIDGTNTTVGYVWTLSNVDGSGSWQVAPGAGGGSPTVEYRTLTGGEATANALTLSGAPAAPSKTLVDILSGGGPMEYTAEFVVTGSTLDWSGGAYAGTLIAGNRLRIVWWP